nr:uncharacterized protein LOC101263682 isoform X3 [Solanum lycopersicum]
MVFYLMIIFWVLFHQLTKFIMQFLLFINDYITSETLHLLVRTGNRNLECRDINLVEKKCLMNLAVTVNWVSGSKKFCYFPIASSKPLVVILPNLCKCHCLVLEPTYFAYSTNDGLGYKSNEDTSNELTSSINLTHEVLSSSGSVSDWIEPSIHICNSKLLQSYGSNRVYDAFYLLQTEPSIQKMVISLSSDKAVWDAVLNNEAVREIRDSLKQVDAADNGLQAGNSEEGLDKSDSDGTVDIIGWIILNTKEKVLEIVEKIIDFVNEWFQPPEEEKTSNGDTDPFEEKLRTSFFLSIVVLLVVVVARAQCA